MLMTDLELLRRGCDKLTARADKIKKEKGTILVISAEQFKCIVDQLPEIEAEPVKHGRWKSVGLASLKCSVCGYVDDHKMYYKGCPECRAKMDKE